MIGKAKKEKKIIFYSSTLETYKNITSRYTQVKTADEMNVYLLLPFNSLTAKPLQQNQSVTFVTTVLKAPRTPSSPKAACLTDRDQAAGLLRWQAFAV